MVQTAEKAQEVRDLKNQITELRNDPDEQEIIFRDTSPKRRKVRIYSMTDGEPLDIPSYLVERTLDKVDPQTKQYMFTARQDQAPVYKMGQIKCFLHPEANERVILDEIGLAGRTCPNGNLASLFSKRIHAQHRHQQEWSAYMEHMESEKEIANNKRQDDMLQATLALAGKAAKAGP